MKNLEIDLCNLGDLTDDVQTRLTLAVQNSEKLVFVEIQRCREAIDKQKKLFYFSDIEKVEYLCNRKNEMEKLQEDLRLLSHLVTDIHNSLL